MIVTEEMRKAGEQMADHLMSASIERGLGDSKLGGCRSFDISNYPPEFHDLILEYLRDTSSVTCIYKAMHNANTEIN